MVQVLLLGIIPTTRCNCRTITTQQYRKTPIRGGGVRSSQVGLQPAGMFRPAVARDDTPSGAGAVCAGSAGVGAGIQVLDLDTANVGGLALAVVEAAEEPELLAPSDSCRVGTVCSCGVERAVDARALDIRLSGGGCLGG